MKSSHADVLVEDIKAAERHFTILHGGYSKSTVYLSMLYLTKTPRWGYKATLVNGQTCVVYELENR